jgi:hypothetical protein
MTDGNAITNSPNETSCGDKNIVMLLTATIDTKNTPFVARNDPKVRLADYKESLRLWLSNPHTPSIVFAENSGYDLTEIRNIYNTCNRHNITVEFISFDDNDYDRSLGKGYGELRIIARALRDSQIIRPNTKLIKVTGRLYIPNIYSLVQGIIKSPDVDIFCDFRCNLTWADSRVFCASRRFFDDFMISMQQEINDTTGMTYEHVLGRAVHRYLAEGLRWAMMPCSPIFFGVSGTSNKTYSRSMFSMVKREMFRRIKSTVLAR